MKAVGRRGGTQKHRGQYDIELFTKAIADAIGTSPWRRRNDDMPVGYLGQAALRREQWLKAGILKLEEAPIATQRRGKHSAATNQHATTEELLEAVFSMWSAPRLYS
jgi:hypothetical protein